MNLKPKPQGWKIWDSAEIPDRELIEAIRSIDPSYIEVAAESTESGTTSKSQEVENTTKNKDKIPADDDLNRM